MRNSLIEVLFPRFCVGCGYVGTYLCQACEARMEKTKDPRCFYCNKPSPFGLTHPGCKKEKGLDGYISSYFYRGLFKKILQESKYNSAHLILKTLLRFPQKDVLKSIKKWNDLYSPTTTYVPLHPQRQRERGFNQSEIITNMLFPQHTKTTLLERIINTSHLALINDKRKRKKQIKGAFRYIEKSPPKSTIVIDDVVTSGATLLECVKVLKKNGIQTVLAFSLAKG